jgi:hypothetical protein
VAEAEVDRVDHLLLGVETPRMVMRPEALITGLSWYFSYTEGMV